MKLIRQGKVRDIHDAGAGRLLLVASDRISAYDVILPTEIPGKGQVLTGLSVHWFGRTQDIVPNHLVSARLPDLPLEAQASDFAGRSMLVDRLEMLPVECVVRGYLAGSGWRDYEATGEVCGHALPPGRRMAEKLRDPLFTPATKAVDGHDENISPERAADLVGRETALDLEAISIRLYERAAAECLERGIILADTKLEFGRDTAGRIVLADEAFTPDSSRFWPTEGHVPGASPDSFDKQYVRDWLDTVPWDRSPPGPEVPHEVVAGTRARYVEAYERIVGRPFTDYVAETTAAAAG